MPHISLHQHDATPRATSLADTWIISLTKVLADPNIPDEIRAELQTQERPKTLDETEQQVTTALANFEEKGLGRAMTTAQPLVKGLLKMGALGTQLASCDPHGIAGLVWGISQILLKGIDKYYTAIEKAGGLADRMASVTERLQTWEGPAESNLFSQRLRRVLENYAHFCVSFVLFLHGLSRPLLSHRKVKKEELSKLVEAVEKECDEAVQDAQAAAASNNAEAHNETHRATEEIKRLIIERQENAQSGQEAHEWQHAIEERLASVQKGTTIDGQHAGEVEQILAQFADQRRRDLALEKHSQFLSWIGCTDTRTIANAKSKARIGLEQTGEWIYNDHIMRPWLFKEPNARSVLWLTADPGFGKSCLAVRIIQDMGGFDTQGVAWFFCTGSSLGDVLQTWIHHLLALKGGKSHLELPESFHESRANGDISVDILCRMLQELSTQKKPTCLVVDGLDECRAAAGGAEQDFRRFFSFLASLPQEWRALVISRNHCFFSHWMEEELGRAMTHRTIIRHDTEEDLRSYAGHEMHELMKRKGSGWNQRLIEESEKLLQEKASGMFMWISLVSSQVQRDKSSDRLGNGLLKLLRGQPEKLQELYENELKALFDSPNSDQDNMSEETVVRLLKAVRWACCAARPLTTGELAAVLDYVSDDDLHEDLERRLGSFVRINDAREIEVVHETAAAFLLETRYALWQDHYPEFAADRKSVHMEMAYNCLAVLTRFNDQPGKPELAPLETGDDRGAGEAAYWRARRHHSQPTSQGGKAREIVQEFFERFQDIFSSEEGAAFLPYAANAWTFHLSSCAPDDRMRGLLRRFCSSQFCTIRWLMLQRSYAGEGLMKVKDAIADGNPHAGPWMATIFHVTGNRAPRIHRHWHRNLRGPLMHTAALYNLTEVVSYCTRRGYKPSLRDQAGSTALHYAALGDAPKAAIILLQAGGDPNARNDIGDRGIVPLVWSLGRGAASPWVPGSFANSKLLLQHGANPNAISTTRESPWSSVRALPQDEAQVKEIFAMLKSHGMVPHEGWHMPIEEAARHNDLDKVRRSVKSGQAVNMLCDRGATRLGRTIFEAPLHAALTSLIRTREMVQLLLDHGADPRMPQSDGRTPLHLAVRRGDHLTDLFCDLGVDINAQAEDGSTPLHDLLRLRSEPIHQRVLTLISYNARIDIRDSFGLTQQDLLRRYNDAQKFHEANVKRYPFSDSDIFRSYANLERRFRFKAPRQLILRILDLASYWKRFASTRREMVRVDDMTLAKDQIYLRSPLLNICHPAELREIRFTITSSDQGWSIHAWAHGSYERCSSFCDIFGARESGEQIEFAGEEHPHYLYDNSHGDRLNSMPAREDRNACILAALERVIVFGRDPPRRTQLVGLPPFDHYRSPPWLDTVRKGDVFCIRQGVREREWVCIVYEAEIELFTSPLLPNVRELHWKVEERQLAAANV